MKLNGEHLFCKQAGAGSIPVSGSTRARCYGGMAGFHPVCPGSIPGARTTSRSFQRRHLVATQVEVRAALIRDSNVPEAQWKSGRLLSDRLQVRVLPGTPRSVTRCWFEPSRFGVTWGVDQRAARAGGVGRRSRHSSLLDRVVQLDEHCPPKAEDASSTLAVVARSMFPKLKWMSARLRTERLKVRLLLGTPMPMTRGAGAPLMRAQGQFNSGHRHHGRLAFW